MFQLLTAAASSGGRTQSEVRLRSWSVRPRKESRISRGRKNSSFQEIRGGHATGTGDRFTQEEEAGVAVLDSRAGREVERPPFEHLAEEPVQGLTSSPEFLVPGDGTETGGVGHEVDEADSVLLFRHFRNDLVERLVEFQEAPFDQEAGGAGDDGLGAGGDEEDGVGAHFRSVEGAHSAEGAGREDAVASADQDGGAVFGAGGQHSGHQSVRPFQAGRVEAEGLGVGRWLGCGPEGRHGGEEGAGGHAGEEEASGGVRWGHGGAEERVKRKE